MTTAAEENRRVVAGLYAAIQAGDMDTALSLFDPEDVELHESPSLPFSGSWRGLDDVTKGIGEVAKVLDMSKVRVGQLVADEDAVVAIIELPTLPEFNPDTPMVALAELFRLRAGKIIEIRPYYWEPTALA